MFSPSKTNKSNNSSYRLCLLAADDAAVDLFGVVPQSALTCSGSSHRWRPSSDRPRLDIQVQLSDPHGFIGPLVGTGVTLRLIVQIL